MKSSSTLHKSAVSAHITQLNVFWWSRHLLFYLFFSIFLYLPSITFCKLMMWRLYSLVMFGFHVVIIWLLSFFFVLSLLTFENHISVISSLERQSSLKFCLFHCWCRSHLHNFISSEVKILSLSIVVCDLKAVVNYIHFPSVTLVRRLVCRSKPLSLLTCTSMYGAWPHC